MNVPALFKSYKTTVAGVLLPIIAFLQTKQAIDAETSTLLLAIATGAGLIASKDGDKSSEDVGASEPTPNPSA